MIAGEAKTVSISGFRAECVRGVDSFRSMDPIMQALREIGAGLSMIVVLYLLQSPVEDSSAVFHLTTKSIHVIGYHNDDIVGVASFLKDGIHHLNGTFPGLRRACIENDSAIGEELIH